VNQSFTITVENTIALRDQVLEGLRVFNEATAGPYNLHHVCLAVRSNEGALIGGLVGLCYWNMLHVDLLWVADAHRRSGCGTALLRRAEEIAAQRGCGVVYLSTYSFQAPEFYRKQGYQAFGTLKDVPNGFVTEWFAKRLQPKAAM